MMNFDGLGIVKPGRVVVLVAVLLAGCAANAWATMPRAAKKRVAAVTTVYYHNSHADVIVSRLFQTQTLDGPGREPAAAARVAVYRPGSA